MPSQLKIRQRMGGYQLTLLSLQCRRNVSLSRGTMKFCSNCPEADLSQVLKGRIVKLRLAGVVISIPRRNNNHHSLARACKQNAVSIFQICLAFGFTNSIPTITDK